MIENEARMSLKFTKILTPTDFSEHSALALDTAMELAQPGSTVILCHIVDDAPLTYGPPNQTFCSNAGSCTATRIWKSCAWPRKKAWI